MPFEVPNIDIIAKAAQIRLVASSATFNDATSAIDEAHQSEDCILAPPLQSWYKNSIIYTLRATWDAHYKIHNIRPLMTHNQLHGRQRKLYNIIDRKATKERAFLILDRRLKYWGCEDIESSRKRVLDMLNSDLAPSIKFTILRTVCNAWRTATRFHSEPNVCLFGCAGSPDSLQHYLVCPLIYNPANSICKININNFTFNSPTLFFHSTYSHLHFNIITHISAVHYILEAIRHGAPRRVEMLYASAIKHLARLDKNIHNFITNAH